MMARLAKAKAAFMSDMSDDSRHELIATAVMQAACQAGLNVQIDVCDEVPLLVGPPTVAKGQATEDAPPVERRMKSICLDKNYLLALYPGRYVVFQRDDEGNWRRRKTPRRNHYKSLRQALADVFEGIIWDRIKTLKVDLVNIDIKVLNPNKQHKMTGHIQPNCPESHSGEKPDKSPKVLDQLAPVANSVDSATPPLRRRIRSKPAGLSRD
jgi:hypothetical protein